MVTCMVRFIFSNDNFASFFCVGFYSSPIMYKNYMNWGKKRQKTKLFDGWEKCNLIRRRNKKYTKSVSNVFGNRTQSVIAKFLLMLFF